MKKYSRLGRMWLVVIIVALTLFGSNSYAQIKQYAVQVSATVQGNPPYLYFSWPGDPNASEYQVFKKEKEAIEWGSPIAVLDGQATSYIDSLIVPGQAFEYGFYKTPPVQRKYIEVANGVSLKFTIKDGWGDGLCCSHGFGSYRIYGNNNTYANGGVFRDQETKVFEVDGGSNSETDNIVIELQLDVYGETTWTLTDNESNEILEQGGPYEGAKYGHVFAGIKYPAIENRGTVVLVIEKIIAQELEIEITQLIQDLVCDGWKVKSIEAEKSDAVIDIKQKIVDLNSQVTDLEAVFILGHVPVPYSGNIQSAHTEHCGAYPADVYYGELDGMWTDAHVLNRTATRSANHNIPGDGKFDQTYLPSDVDLQVGRVDLSNLPVFNDNEIELTRKYLEKNHEYRTGETVIARRGLISDGLAQIDLLGMAVGAIGFRNFAALFGSSNIKEGGYFSTMVNASYIWSQGCGFGSYTSCSGVGSSSGYSNRMVRSVFTMLYGSYFGDWDNKDNFLRAPLASEPSMLASMWAGAPAWHIHHMALGETLGYVTRLSQNNSTLYAPSDRVRQIHVALMGDPTLRLHAVKPPKNLNAHLNGGMVELEWTPSEDDVVGYYVYRSEAPEEDYIRISDEIIAGTEFYDYPNDGTTYSYMVRAVKLELSGGGSYYNLSQGVLGSVSTSAMQLEKFQAITLDCFPNPICEDSKILLHTAIQTEVEIDLINVQGMIVDRLFSGLLPPGESSFKLTGIKQSGTRLPNGIYWCRCSSSVQNPQYQKVVILHGSHEE